jgi:hypothetical protein
MGGMASKIRMHYLRTNNRAMHRNARREAMPDDDGV